MTNADSPHDKLFKEAFGSPESAAAELRSVLPAGLVAQLDFGSLNPVPASFLDDNFRSSYSDLLFTARYSGKETLLYLLFEHKSQVERWTLFQLLRYMMRIWERVLGSKPPPRVLPLVIPVVLHHSGSGWTAATSFQELFDPELIADPELRRFVPSFEVVLDDISHVSDEALRQRSLTEFGVLSLLFLRDARTDPTVLESLDRWADLFRALLPTPEGRHAVLVLFGYLTAVTDLELAALYQAVTRAIPEAEELMMTLEQRLIQQGRQEGRQEGLQQGLQQGLQGQRSLVRRLLEKKFGPLSDDVLARLEAAGTDKLEQYADRVLTASTVSEVLSD